MIDVLSKLNDSNPSKDNPFYSTEQNRSYLQKSNSKSFNSASSSFNAPFIDNNIAMAIAGSVVNGNSSDHVSSPNGSLPSSPQHYRHTLIYQAIDEETTKILISCFLWTIGNIDQRLFRLYLNEFSNERLLAFLELLRLSCRVFEYKGEFSFRKMPSVRFHKQKMENVIRCGQARRDLMRRRDFSQSFGSSDNTEHKLRWKKDATLWRYNSLPRSIGVSFFKFFFSNPNCF